MLWLQRISCKCDRLLLRCDIVWCFGPVQNIDAVPADAWCSMSTFWGNACSTALNRPLQTLLDTSYASCGVTVS